MGSVSFSIKTAPYQHLPPPTYGIFLKGKPINILRPNIMNILSPKYRKTYKTKCTGLKYRRNTVNSCEFPFGQFWTRLYQENRNILHPGGWNHNHWQTIITYQICHRFRQPNSTHNYISGLVCHRFHVCI